MIGTALNVFLEITVTICVLLLFVVASFACRSSKDKCEVEVELHLTRRMLESRLTKWRIRHDGRVMRRELESELRRR